MDRPGEEWDHGRENECSRAFQSRAPRPGDEQRNEAEREQHRVSRADERENGDTQAHEGEAARGGSESGPDDEECPGREAGGEHGLAREFVVHQCVSLVEEQGGCDADRYPRPKVSGCPSPADDRAGVEERHERLGQPPVEDVEREAGEERRDRRPEEHRPREEDVAVEKLDVGIEVLVEIATGLEWPRERPHDVCDESQSSEHRGSERSRGERLEPRGRSSEALVPLGHGVTREATVDRRLHSSTTLVL